MVIGVRTAVQRALMTAGSVLAVSAYAPPAGAQFQAPLVPTPIGAGPDFQPPARWPLAGAAAYGGLRSNLFGPLRVHLELFAEGKVVVVPGGIGVSGGRTVLYSHIVDALWHGPAWTLDPGGVIHLARPGLRLADVFAVWGQPLEAHRLLTFVARDPEGVQVFVNGERHAGAPGEVVLRDRDQVVVQINGYLPPHRSFVFAPDRR
jgi:hypothetical protein